MSNNGPHHDHLEYLIAPQSNWTAHYTLTVTMLNEHPVMTEDIKTCTRDRWQSIDMSNGMKITTVTFKYKINQSQNITICQYIFYDIELESTK